MAKRLTRDVRNKKIAGVCAGVANYFDIDPTIVRLIWGVAFFVYGIGLIPYLILWLVLLYLNSIHRCLRSFFFFFDKTLLTLCFSLLTPSMIGFT